MSTWRRVRGSLMRNSLLRERVEGFQRCRSLTPVIKAEFESVIVATSCHPALTTVLTFVGLRCRLASSCFCSVVIPGGGLRHKQARRLSATSCFTIL